MPAGLAFRENKANSTFGDLSPFLLLLHTIEKDSSIGTYEFRLTQDMVDIRTILYDKYFAYPYQIYNDQIKTK